MKKQLTNLMVLLLVATSIFAQSPQFSKKVQVKTSKNSKRGLYTQIDYIGENSSQGMFAVVGFRKGSPFYVSPKYHYKLFAYDYQMGLVNSVPLNFKGEEHKTNYASTLYFNKNLYLFTTVDNKDGNTTTLFVQSVNEESLELNNDKQKIDEFYFTKKYDYRSISTMSSPDGSKVLVTYPIHKSENVEKIVLHVFDKDMKSLYKQEIDKSLDDQTFIVEESRIENNGDVYLLGRAVRKHDRTLIYYSMISSYDIDNYNFIKVTNQGQELETFKLHLYKKLILKSSFAIGAGGNIQLAGLYKEYKTPEPVFMNYGSFYITLDANNGKFLDIETNPFTFDIFTKNWSKRAIKYGRELLSKGHGLDDAEYRFDVVMKPHGGAFTILEQNSRGQSSGSYISGDPSMHSSPNTYYTSKTILVSNYDKTGKLLWNESIDKKMTWRTDPRIEGPGRYNSYTMAYVDDKLYFAFNDNVKNLKLKEGQKPFIFNKGNAIISFVELDEQGKQTRLSLFDYYSSSMMLSPKWGGQIASDKLILFNQSQNRQNFTKVTFE